MAWSGLLLEMKTTVKEAVGNTLPWNQDTWEGEPSLSRALLVSMVGSQYIVSGEAARGMGKWISPHISLHVRLTTSMPLNPLAEQSKNIKGKHFYSNDSILLII